METLNNFCPSRVSQVCPDFHFRVSVSGDRKKYLSDERRGLAVEQESRAAEPVDHVLVDVVRLLDLLPAQG